MYQWRVLPFGIKSAPGLVQHSLRKAIFNQNIGLDAETESTLFIDDSLFICVDSESALNDLPKILAAYKRCGLRLKMDKCKFLVTETTFMGAKLCNQSRRTGYQKVPKKYQNWFLEIFWRKNESSKNAKYRKKSSEIMIWIIFLINIDKYHF